MAIVKIDRAELEYGVQGSGEPVLLISTGPIADSFLPFWSEKALCERYQLIRYRQQRLGQGTTSQAPVSFAEHAADAAALLDHLGVGPAHIVGHSTGAVVALQLAVDYPLAVHTLALLEPVLLSVPSAGAFFEKAGPAVAAYGAGDREEAMELFLTMVSGLDWRTCRTFIEMHVPGGAVKAMKNPDNWFGSYLPALGAWQFSAQQATSISQPVLSVLGTDTDQLFIDGHALLHSWFPQIEDCIVEDIGHLLHLQCPGPVARGVAGFLDRHPLKEVRIPAVAGAFGIQRSS